ncbi:MAG: hypothetical protein ACPGYK_10200 [Flavobacteriales bacterium]
MTHRLPLLLVVLCLISAPVTAQWNLMGEPFHGGVGDQLGRWEQVDISGDGHRIAYGTPNNSDNFPWSGYAKVFEWTGDEWVQMGAGFHGVDPLQDEGTGSSVSLDQDGSTFALGIAYSPNSMGWRTGGVRIYDWNGAEWTQRGDQIEGEGDPNPFHQTDTFGQSVSLSADGNTVIIGAEGNTLEPGVLNFQGHAKVYDWDGSTWVQRGQDLFGLTGLEQFGRVVRISADGQRVAVAARSRWNAEETAHVGAVTAYAWNAEEGVWEEMGDPLMGTVNNAMYGESISLDGDGTTLAITAKFGLTEVRDWNGADWVIRGDLDQSGGLMDMSSVSLSADGDVIAIGDPWFNWMDGRMRVLEWNENDWELVEETLEPLPDGASLQGFGLALALNDNAGRLIVGSGYTNRIEVFEREGFVGTPTPAEPRFHAYPNPTAGPLRLGVQPNASWSLWSVQGQHIFDGSGEEADLSRCVPGTYLLHCEGDVIRVVVQK